MMDDAQIVGRLLDSELLRDLGQIGICRDPGKGDGGVAYATAKAFGCSLLDLPAQKAVDGKNVQCTAASFAIGATFAPAKLAPVAAPATLGPDICGDPSDKCP